MHKATKVLTQKLYLKKPKHKSPRAASWQVFIDREAAYSFTRSANQLQALYLLYLGFQPLTQKCAAKNAKCKECHKIGHFHKVCQSRKRGRRAHLVQTTPQTEQDTHIDENGVRQPNPPMVNMLKIVNHIGATKGSQEKHLKFPINVDPRGPYKHHLVVRVYTGADVNCMNEKTFKRLFP